MHLFETEQDGWGTKVIKDISYLGTLNEGEWFKVTIIGGWGENDFSTKLVRVLKILNVKNKLLVDNFISLEGGI
jgi:hypothetical protein